MSLFEKSYSVMFKNVLRAANPIKKRIIKTECEVHRFINNQGVEILKNDGYIDTYNLMSKYMKEINEGTIWADQDFKSANHFYNPETGRGLYGNSNAFREIMTYYGKALNLYYNGDVRDAMFYFGAACHIIQDLTVPQHVNVRLLDKHRQYERWIIRTYKEHDLFKAYRNGIYLKTIPEFIEYNSRHAICAYKKFLYEKNRQIKFFKTTSVILVLAQKTTAGAMLKFYNDIQKMKPYIENRKKDMLEV